MTLEIIRDVLARYAERLEHDPQPFLTRFLPAVFDYAVEHFPELHTERSPEVYQDRLSYIAKETDSLVPATSTCTIAQMMALRYLLRFLVLPPLSFTVEPAWTEAVTSVCDYAKSLSNGRFRQAFRPGQAQCRLRMLLWAKDYPHPSSVSDVFKLLNPSATLSKEFEEKLLSKFESELEPNNPNRYSWARNGSFRFCPWIDLVTEINNDRTSVGIDYDEVLDAVLSAPGLTICEPPSPAVINSHRDLLLSLGLNLGEGELHFLEWEKWSHGPTGSTGLVAQGFTRPSSIGGPYTHFEYHAPVIDNEMYEESFDLFEDSALSNRISEIFDFVSDPDGPSGIVVSGDMLHNPKKRMVEGIIREQVDNYEPRRVQYTFEKTADGRILVMPQEENRNRIDIPQVKRATSDEIGDIQAILNKSSVRAKGGGGDIITALFWDKSVGAWGDAMFPDFYFETFWIYVGRNLAHVRLKVSQIYAGHNRRYDMTIGFEALDILRIEMIDFPMEAMGSSAVGVTITFNKVLTARRFIAEPIATRNQENDLVLDAFTFYVSSEQNARSVMSLVERWALKSQEDFYESSEAAYRINPPEFKEFPEPPGSTVRD